MSDGRINSVTASSYSITRKLSYYDSKTRVELNGSCLKRDKTMYNHRTIVNIYIVYDLSSDHNSFDLALENCLSGAVKLATKADIDKHKYSGYGIRFDLRGTFLFLSGKFAQNVVIFGVHMSSFVHVDNQKKNILILGVGQTQGLDDTTLTTEKNYSINCNSIMSRIHFKRLFRR